MKNSVLAKSAGIWILLSVMVMRILALFISINFVQYMIVPGALVYGFFIYYSLKKGVFMYYGSFILAVFLISLGLVLSYLFIWNFISLQHSGYRIYIISAIGASSIIIPNVLYWIVFLIRRLIRT